jgi:hypothetical protein
LLVTAVAALGIQVLSGAESEQRSFRTTSGPVVVTVPKDWPAVETEHHVRGITSYRLGPADANLVLELRINDAALVKTNSLADSDLERFLESICSSIAKTSVEGKVQPHRFGAGKDGVYARFTGWSEKPDKAKPFHYLTRGVRLVGTNVVAFALISNDADRLALSNTLAIVESVRIGKVAK